MKKPAISILFLFFVLVGRPQEKPGPPKPPSIEERIKKTNQLLSKDVKPTASQQAAIETAFRNFFIAEDKTRKDNPPPSPPNPKGKEAMDQLIKQRDEAIKKILSADQYEKYRETIKKLRPPMPPPGEKPAQ